MDNRKLISVDLGTGKIGVSVAVREADGKFRVEVYNDYPSAGIKGGKITNSKEFYESLKDALDKMSSAVGIKIENVIVNRQKFGVKLQESSFSYCISDGGYIDDDGIRSLRDMMLDDFRTQLDEGEEIFTAVPLYYNTEDEMNIRPSKLSGKDGGMVEGRFAIFTGSDANDRKIDKAFANAGVMSVRKEFAPDLMGRGLLTATEMDNGVALFDLGAGASSVAVFYNGVLMYYGAIPFGGNTITEDIRNICGISFTLAENIKLGFGGCMPDRLLSLGDKKLKIIDKENGRKTEIPTKYLSEIITARQKEIVDALLYEIQRSGFKDKLRSGIVLTGGGANMLNISLFVKELSGYTVRLGCPARDVFSADSNFFKSDVCGSAALICKGFDEDIATTVTENPAISGPSIETLFTAGEIVEVQTGGAKSGERSGTREKKKTKESGISYIGGFFSGLFDEKNGKNVPDDEKEDPDDKVR